jgi:glutathione S-transferase
MVCIKALSLRQLHHWDEMRILFVNGTKLDLTWHEMQRVFWHPSFVALVLVISAIIILLRPYGDLVQLNAMSLTVFYANGVVTFMALLVASVYVICHMGKTVVTAVVISIAVIAATLWGLAFGVLLGADVPRVVDFFLVTGFNLTFAFLGELVLSTFLLSRILKDILAPEARTQFAAFMTDTAGGLHILARPPPLPEVNLLGRRFVTNQIMCLQAEEHYVLITLKDAQTQLLRGKISDAVAVLSAVDGKRIHRSHWIAADAVAGWRADRSGHIIVTCFGKDLPVARNRQQEVRAWAEAIMARPTNEKAPVKGA